MTTKFRQRKCGCAASCCFYRKEWEYTVNQLPTVVAEAMALGAKQYRESLRKKKKT